MNETNATAGGPFDWDGYCRDGSNGGNGNSSTETAAICALWERIASTTNDSEDAVRGDSDDGGGDGDDDVRITLRDVTTLFHLLGGVLILWTIVGYTMRLAGKGRTSFTKDNLTKSLAATPLASLVAFYLFGYAFAFGPAASSKADRRNFVGIRYRALRGVPDDDDSYSSYATFYVQASYCLSSTGIWTGTIAERGHMALFFYGTAFLAAWVYPVVAHALWSPNGVLSAYLTSSSSSSSSNDALYHGMGVIDLQGSGVVHMTGGVAAFVAAKILKPRTGRFHDPTTGIKLDHPTRYRVHSVGLQALGTFFFWMGSYGPVFLYDSARVASLVAINTTLAAGTAGLVGLFADAFLSSTLTGLPEYHLPFALHGAETGLASIAAGAAVVEPWAAAVIGAVAGTIHVLSHRLVEGWKFFRVDDIVDAVPVHGYGGMWGLLSVSIFAKGTLLERAGLPSDVLVGLAYGFMPNIKFLLVQLTGLAFILGWVSINTAFVCFVLKFLGILREEIVPDGKEVKVDDNNHETSSNDGNNEDDHHGADPSGTKAPVDHDDDDDEHKEDVDDSSANYLSDDIDPDDDVELQEALQKRNEKYSRGRNKTEGLDQNL